MGKKIGNGNMPAVIYTDAVGTVSGGNFQAVDRILNEPWYQEFDKDKVNIKLVADYVRVSSEMQRTMFFLRRMDYFSSGAVNNILKLDVDYSSIARTITNSKYASTVYVCKGDNILFFI